MSQTNGQWPSHYPLFVKISEYRTYSSIIFTTSAWSVRSFFPYLYASLHRRQIWLLIGCSTHNSTIIANTATTKQPVKGKQVPDWSTSQSEHIGIADERKKVRKRWTADRINSRLIPPQNGNVMFTALQVHLSNAFPDFSPSLCFL